MNTTLSAQSLIVPIKIEALCVGENDVNGSNGYGTTNFARVAADFSAMPYLGAQGNAINAKANISEAVLPAFFEPVSDPLQQGIHLHWALPDALSHGLSDEQGNIVFPETPNRWLVARVATNNANPAAPITDVKAWIIESDRLWDKEQTQDSTPQQNLYSQDVPIEPIYDENQLPNKTYQAMGRVFVYETWSEQSGGVYISKHTALGYGIPTYAAAYAHCRNVFSFYDTMADLDLSIFVPASSKISFMVCGWYSKAQDDPLVNITYPDGADYDQKLKQVEDVYKWTFTADKNNPFPSQTICNGLLYDITWDPANNYIQQRPANNIEVSIGNTTAEALSAMIASQQEFAGLPKLERVLNALQLGLLTRLDLLGGLANFEEALHQKDFGSVTSGHIWIVKKKSVGDTHSDDAQCRDTQDEQSAQVSDNDLIASAASLGKPLPQALATALNDLNICQQQCDKAQFEVDSLRGQIFADWYKYMILEYPQGPPPTLQPTANDAFQFVNNEAQVTLSDKVAALGQLTASLNAQIGKVNSQLGDDYILKCAPSPRYWQANNPVILLSGDDLDPDFRYGGDDRYADDKNLLCRLTASLVRAMEASPGSFTIEASNLPQLPDSSNQSLVAELNALFGEAFFLDTNQAWALAKAVAALGGDDNPAITNLSDFVSSVQAAQQNLVNDNSAGGSVTFIGSAPSPVGFQQWANPWVPLLLQSDVNYYPIQPIADDQSGTMTDYSPAFITSNYLLDDDDIDLVYQGSGPQPSSALQQYQGMILLTRNTEINIKAQIDSFLASFPDDDYYNELNEVRDNLNLSMMAQALGGFNEALIMRKQTLQLPVFDPLAMTNGFLHYEFSNVTVKNAVAAFNDTAPMPHNYYNPIRAGFMKINRLRVIDVFGQIMDIDNPPVIRAESLIPPNDQPADPLIGLPPRITQPSRLLFRWLSANDDLVEMNSDPASTPVCGWVLFNHLDNNLMIYDASGNALGSLNVNGPLWQGAPGDNQTFDQPIETVFADANLHLKNFALGIYNNPDAKQFLSELLQTIDRTVINVNPNNYKQDPGLAVLIGRPLALVRASLGWELQGLPAINQSWASFASAIQNNEFDNRNNANFTSVNLPVRLGNLSQTDDGLIGYFIDDGSSQAYLTFYAAASKFSQGGVIPPAFDQLVVQAGDSPQAITLSMLIDPRAPVHATTGILPVKQISIPPAMYVNAVKRMAVTFLTTPVLSSSATFSVPTPTESGYDWSWVTVDPLTNKWSVTSPVPQVNTKATLTYQPQQISEGWLKLSEVVIPPGDGQESGQE